MAKSTSEENNTRIAFYYRLFFLYVEPLSALSGAICAGVYPSHYLAMTEKIPSESSWLPLGMHVGLRQLANMYLLFALNEALLLRITSDSRVWRALLLNLLIADLGHLYSLTPLGYQVYYEFWNWNAMDWGNVPFVYLGMTSRLSFLLGLGVKSKRD
ncbi:hypothetical protein BGW36DRAFT_385085 [Talaromyces proteolyticus]|uniref:DUF7704 domain-containing protein n=1 Tax=Talaromyces proteolyticus TaxID=1131652 RepID=A0AAD4KNW7_9EURO|nr:uncharacterized protein BGW36DRAFT_385085 [Talaromyces proteolyticus]KAH8692736.1 hypothetical protein BGW36DRAFT_385085 [Talaromyces proteolyticus]